MGLKMHYSKLKLLYVNIFGILYKASVLNVIKLQQDLAQVKILILPIKQEAWIKELFIFIITTIILCRFAVAFAAIVSNVVAIYPILTNTQPDLLLPTITLQSIDNVVLNIIEVIIGYLTVKYLQPHNMPYFAIFIGKMIIKTSLSITALNFYTDFYNHIAYDKVTRKLESGHRLKRESTEEFEILHRNFT